MKGLISKVLNAVARARSSWSGLQLRVGRGSKVYLWRIKGPAGSRCTIGSNSMVLTTLALERAEASVTIGDRTFIGGGGLFSVASGVTVGSDVMLSWGCTITDHDSHSLDFRQRANDVMQYLSGTKDWSAVPIAPVRIEDKVWIGFNCSVLKGVTVGEGAVVAANSNVTRNVPPWTLVAGNPARVIRELSKP